MRTETNYWEIYATTLPFPIVPDDKKEAALLRNGYQITNLLALKAME